MKPLELDIEGALQWAFHRELVHHARKPGFEATSCMMRGSRDSLSRLGVAVNSSINLGFEAPGDAYVVADAVKALPDRYDFELPDELLPNLALAKTIIADRSRARRPFVNPRELVLFHAKTATRPDFCEQPAPLFAIDDGVVFVPGSGGRREWYCRIRYIGDNEDEVIRLRMAFLVWRIALEAVRDSLRQCGKLKRIRLSDALPPIPATDGA